MELNVKFGFIINNFNRKTWESKEILLFFITLTLFFFSQSELKAIGINITNHDPKAPTQISIAHRIKSRFLHSSTNIKINGRLNSEIIYGDSVKLEFSFFPGRSKAEFSVFIDSNNNGIFDKEDLQYGKSIIYTDGDINDLDKKMNSHYRTTLSVIQDMDIPVYNIIDKEIFFRIDDGICHSIASLKVNPPQKSFLISGLVKNPVNKANLAIIVQSNDKKQTKYLTFTDKDGYFCTHIPDYSTDPYYYVSSEDYFNILKNNYFQPLPVVIDKRTDKNIITLSYSIKTSYFRGRITDLNNNPVRGVGVYAQNPEKTIGESIFSGTTDSSGYFKIGVLPGIYKINLIADDIFPSYMYPEELPSINVLEGQVKEIDFKLLKNNGLIKGSIRIDGKAAKDIFIAAWNDQGSIWSKTNSKGAFFLNVNKDSRYHLEINPESIPPGYFAANSIVGTIKPDSEAIIFEFKKATVRFRGVVNGKESGLPIENALITATDGKHTFFTRTDANGRYSIMGEGGNYCLIALSQNFHFNQADTNLIANNGYYNVDFLLKESESKFGGNNIGTKETKIKYILPRFSHVVLKIYDLSGKEIATLEDKKKSAGTYEINFDSYRFANGVYIYKLITGQFSETKKFVIAR